MSSVLILGATSAIAEHIARTYADQGHKLTLVARSAERLQQTADDLKVRSQREVLIHEIDFLDHGAQADLVQKTWDGSGGYDIILIAYGTLDDQMVSEQSADAAVQSLETNFVSVVHLCTLLANRLEKQGNGTLAVIGSVAGDRGRRSNYVYGSAKAGLEAFLSGLRARMNEHGVKVLTIKPGMVDTPMTAHLPKGPLFAKPEKVAGDIVKAIAKGKAVIYTPFYWWGVMRIIKCIPEFVFKKLSF